MPKVDTADLISVTDASKMGVSALVRDAEAGRDHIVLRNNKPVAAVVGMGRYEELQDLQDDLADLALAAARSLTTGERRYTLDDVLARFGYTREQLRDLTE